MNTKDRIIKAKIALLLKEPFLGQLVCYLDMIEDNKNNETAAVSTEGKLYYNEKFMSKLFDNELEGLLAHEVYHLVFEHPYRGFNKGNHKIWNIAADIKVNSMVSNSFTLPDLVRIFGKDVISLTPENDEIKIGDVVIKSISQKTTEQIYTELLRNKQELKKIHLDIILSKNKDKEQDQNRQIWRDRINGAMAAAKMKGSLPEGLERELDSFRNPTLPWKSILTIRFSELYKEKTWKRPNKKMLPYYFPGSNRVKNLNAVVAVDTSGSISNEEFSKFLTEVLSLTNQFSMLRIDLIDCDCKIKNVFEINERNKAKLRNIKMNGYGGTDFRPVFKWIRKKKMNKIDCLIYLTDGYGNFPDSKPSYPVFWISTSDNVKYPFGRRIPLKLRDGD